MAASIFSSLNYYEAGSLTDEARDILAKSNAKQHTYLSERVKIAITDTNENPDEYSEISDIYDIPIVSCDWVVKSYLCGKLLPYKPFPPKQIASLLFTGKVFTSSGLDKSDCNAVWAMITFNGGECRRKLSDKTTHLVTIGNDRNKVKQCQNLPNVRIVTPDWIVNCIKENKILSEPDYHPKLLVQPVSHTTPQHLLNTGGNENMDKSYIQATTAYSVPVPPPPMSSHQHIMHTSIPRHKMIANNSSFMPRYRSPIHVNSNPTQDQTHAYRPQTTVPPPYMQQQLPSRHNHGGMMQHQPGYLPQPTNMNYPGAYHARAPGTRPMTPNSTGHMPVSAHMFAPMNQGVSQMPPSQPAGQGNNTMTSGQPRPNQPMHDSMMNKPSSATNLPHQRSPISHRTPPAINLGQMNEVPYPSQATLPEETPIIRMTNMAAFPMGHDQKKLTSNTTTRMDTTPSSIPNPNTQSPLAKTTSANISVIKTAKSPVAEHKDKPSGRTVSSASHTSTSTPTSTSSTAATAHHSGVDVNSNIYYGYDTTETVPKDMCLIGCIFYMGDYSKIDSELCDEWIKSIEQNGGTVDPSYSNRVTHVLVECQASDVCRLALNDHKRVVTAHWLNDVIAQGQMEPPWRAHHLPHPYTPDKPHCSNQVIGVTGFDHKERFILQTLIKMIGASYTSYLARTNTVLVCKRLEGEKVKKAKEWGIVCVNAQWLSEVALGHLRALKLPIDKKYFVFGTKEDDFDINPSMAPVVMSGWRVPLKIPKDCWRKFKPSSKSADAATENKRRSEDESFGNPTKRIRLQEIQNTKSNLPMGQRPVVMLTGFTKVEKTRYKEMVESLGGIVTSDASKCTHLIAEKILRTPNFMRAVNYCMFITSAEWITESLKCNHFVDERVFTLQNTEAGSMWNMLEALERRRTHGRPFAGLTFHITPGVPTSTLLPRKFLCELVNAAGGSIQDLGDKRWSAKRVLEAQKATQNNKLSYIVVTCKDDTHLCMDLLNNNIDIFSVEFILSGVMNQQASYDAALTFHTDS